MVQFNGIADARNAILDRLFTEGRRAFELPFEDLVKMLVICGTPDEGRALLAEFDDLLGHVVLHAPYCRRASRPRVRTASATRSRRSPW
jgi:hypothetical protein